MMATPALAQQGGGQGMGHGWGSDPGDRLDRHVSYLEDRLDLSEDQVNQVEAILKESHAESAAFKNSHHDATHVQIEGILTDEQKVTFADMGKRMRGHSGHKGSGHGMRQEAFMEELGLTDEQRKPFNDLQTSHRAAMKAWREQNPDPSPEDLKAFRDEMHKSGRATLEGFLTPEQLEKVDEHHKNMGSMGSMGKPHGIHRGAGRVMEQLNLTDEQKAQVKTMRQEQCVSMREGLQSILTAEQLDELQELREARKQHWRGWGGNWMGDCRK